MAFTNADLAALGPAFASPPHSSPASHSPALSAFSSDADFEFEVHDPRGTLNRRRAPSGSQNSARPTGLAALTVSSISIPGTASKVAQPEIGYTASPTVLAQDPLRQSIGRDDSTSRSPKRDEFRGDEIGSKGRGGDRENAVLPRMSDSVGTLSDVSEVCTPAHVSYFVESTAHCMLIT